MADVLVARPGFRDLQVRYVDMLDTTWAEKVVAVNPDGTNIGGGGGGGGIVQQGAKDLSAQPWKVESYVGAAAIDPRSIRALTIADVVDIADRAARAVGVVYGSQGAALLQKATFGDLLVQLRSGGAEVDPRARTWTLASGTDSVDVGDRAARALGVVASITAVVHVDDNAGSLTVDAPVATPVAVRLSDGAAFIDPRDVSDRAARLVGRVYGSQGNQLVQTAVNFNQQVEIAVGAVLIDPRSIRTLTTADAVTATIAVASDPTKLEDAASVSGDRGAFVLGVRNDLLATLTSNDADYSGFAVDAAGRTMVREQAVLIATTISAANAAVTLTIAAAGAGLFHYITSIEIINVNPTATAIAGSAVTLSYTSTNIPGAPAWTAGNALAAGAEKVVERITYPPGGIKTTTAATATTIVAPAIGAGGVCRITVTYFIAP